MNTILVVDDQSFCRELVASALKRHGYSVLCAATGSHAISIIARQDPDLVLLDITMPILDGMTVLRVLRESEEHADLPVILLTGMEDERVLREAKALGVQGWVRKEGFSLEVLLARICDVLGPAPEPVAVELAADRFGEEPDSNH